MSKLTSGERSTCHARPRGTDGHEPWDGSFNRLSSTCKHCKRPITNVLGAWMLEKGQPAVPPPEKSQYVLLDCAGTLTTCDRCGANCRVADRRNPDSKPFKLSEKPKGFCANCVMTQFLYNTYPVNLQIDEAGPELLLKPGIREAFLSSGMMDHCDLNINEVNWATVVANWQLPVKRQESPMNPYKVGDSPKSHMKPKGSQPREATEEEFREHFNGMKELLRQAREEAEPPQLSDAEKPTGGRVM